MDFHNVNLPSYIELFAVGSSEFSTSYAISFSGREARSSDSQIARRRYSLKDCRLSRIQFEGFNSFFMARAGRRFSFRLKDYFDFTVDKQALAACDDTGVKFQLCKLYPDLLVPHIRVITKPKVGTLKFWINGTEIIPQNVDYGTGVVGFARPLEENMQLLASFEFDVPVRFENDSFSYSFNSDGTISLDNLELVEVIE